jgi:hypothetical protein
MARSAVDRTQPMRKNDAFHGQSGRDWNLQFYILMGTSRLAEPRKTSNYKKNDSATVTIFYQL